MGKPVELERVIPMFRVTFYFTSCLSVQTSWVNHGILLTSDNYHFVLHFLDFTNWYNIFFQKATKRQCQKLFVIVVLQTKKKTKKFIFPYKISKLFNYLCCSCRSRQLSNISGSSLKLLQKHFFNLFLFFTSLQRSSKVKQKTDTNVKDLEYELTDPVREWLVMS